MSPAFCFVISLSTFGYLGRAAHPAEHAALLLTHSSMFPENSILRSLTVVGLEGQDMALFDPQQVNIIKKGPLMGNPLPLPRWITPPGQALYSLRCAVLQPCARWALAARFLPPTCPSRCSLACSHACLRTVVTGADITSW